MDIFQFRIHVYMSLFKYVILIVGICLTSLLILMFYPVSNTQAFSLGSVDRFVARGFHAAETTPDGRGFRWTDGNSHLWLSSQGKGRHTLQFTATAPPPIIAPARVELSLNGRSFVYFTVGRDIRNYWLLMPYDNMEIDNNFVQIISPSYPSQNEIVPRSLGIVIFEAEWKCLDYQHWLIPIQILVIVSACAILLFLALQLGFSFVVCATVNITFAALLLISHTDLHFSVRWHVLIMTFLIGVFLLIAAVFTKLLSGYSVQLHDTRFYHRIFLIFLIVSVFVFVFFNFTWKYNMSSFVLSFILVMSLVFIFSKLHAVKNMFEITYILLSLLVMCVYFIVHLNCAYNHCPFTVYSHPPIRSDGNGYYAYLPAVLIDHDLTLETLMQRLDTNTVGRFPETGRYLIKYSMGVAVMMLPFFVIGHLLTLLTGYPVDGFSLFYQLSVGFAGLLYASIGLFLLKRILEDYFNPWIVFTTLICILFGTNLFHYTVFDSTFSHAFSFCLFTLLLYLLPKWYQNISFQNSLLLALICGMIILVRIPNGLVWVFIPLFGLSSLKELKERLFLFWKKKSYLAWMILVIIIIQLPQLLYWYFITGQWMVNSYQHEGFRFWKEPHVWGVLFGEQRGLLVWAPILALCIPGLWVMRHKVQSYFLPTMVFLPILLYLTASWHDQGLGATYGQRLWIDSLSILALPLASLLSILHSKRTRITVIALIGFLILLSLTQTFRYWQGEIHPYNPTWQEYLAVLEFWKSIFVT